MNQDENMKGQDSHAEENEVVKKKFKRRSLFLKKENARMKFYLYATVILLMVSLGANLIISLRYNELIKENEELLLSRRKITADYATLRDQYDDLFQQFSMLTNPMVKLINLKATNNGFDVPVYYNEANGAIIINISSIPESESSSNYYLEVTDKVGQKHDLGIIENTKRTSILKIMPPVEQANRFVIYRSSPSQNIETDIVSEGLLNP